MTQSSLLTELGSEAAEDFPVGHPALFARCSSPASFWKVGLLSSHPSSSSEEPQGWPQVPHRPEFANFLLLGWPAFSLTLDL